MIFKLIQINLLSKDALVQGREGLGQKRVPISELKVKSEEPVIPFDLFLELH